MALLTKAPAVTHGINVGDFIEALENSTWDRSVRKGWTGYVSRLVGSDGLRIETNDGYGQREVEARIFKVLIPYPKPVNPSYRNSGIT